MTTDLFLNQVTTPKSKVLIVDDDAVSREMLRFALEDDFDVEDVDSGETCLMAVAAQPPDLVILDIEMPGLGGYDTCRKLRETHDMPIIFVSSHDTVEERIEAFDCGATNFVVKPFDAGILARKVKVAIDTKLERDKLVTDKEVMQKTAMNFLANISDSGVLLQFMRSNLGCTSFEDLARGLLETTRQYDVNCHIQIRHPDGIVTMTPQGPATPLEESVLEKTKDMGRIFQFRSRLIINYDQVSILVMGAPDDADMLGRIRDNLCILAESAEAIAETISMRKNSAERAEQLQAATISASLSIEEVRELYRSQLGDSRLLLQQLVDEVEKAYLFLGLNDNQERMVSEIMHKNVEPVLGLFERSALMEDKFNDIVAALTTKGSNGAPEVWLF